VDVTVYYSKVGRRVGLVRKLGEGGQCLAVAQHILNRQNRSMNWKKKFPEGGGEIRSNLCHHCIGSGGKKRVGHVGPSETEVINPE
jgi:hypothetical protein